MESLLPMEVMLKTDVGRYTVMELNMLLSTSKEAFVSPQSTRPVVDHIKTILEKVCYIFFKKMHNGYLPTIYLIVYLSAIFLKESKLTPDDCESINNCLLLLRNILHIPEHRPAGNGASMQNQILWNLFAQNVDKVLIQLMTCKYQVCFLSFQSVCSFIIINISCVRQCCVVFSGIFWSNYGPTDCFNVQRSTCWNVTKASQSVV